MKILFYQCQRVSLILIVSTIFIFISCNKNKIVEKPIAVLSPNVEHFAKLYIKEINETFSSSERIIYIELAGNKNEKILMITNDINSTCVRDTIFDYFAKVESFDIIISGKDKTLFKSKKNSFKKINICKQSDSLYTPVSFSPEAWFFYLDNNNVLINVDIPSIRNEKLANDSIVSKIIKLLFVN